jgi:hypothetical protein
MKGVGWTYLAEDREKGRVLMKPAITPHPPQKKWKFLEYLRACYFLKKNCVPWSLLVG